MGPCDLCHRFACPDPVLHAGILETDRLVRELLGPALDRAVLDATQHGTLPKE